jgi:glutathione peroxidase
VGRDGRSVSAFSSMTSPDDRDFLAEVEKRLAAKP